ncbi:MAG: hypothetical protein ACPL4C_03245 [Brevinematia bacterium]|jgi:hypothetical protein
MSKKIIKFTLTILLPLSISSCIIGEIQSGFPLDPPLGLELTQVSNNSILSEWWGYNTESYFSGYVIFITTNSNDLYQDRNSTNHFNKPYLTNSLGNLPTIFAPIPSTTTKYSFTITQLPNGNPITTNITYYVAVAAYSASKSAFSPLSNITNITLTN